MSLVPEDADDLMAEALGEARKALTHGDVPIGAVVADSDGHIVGRGHNRREIDSDPTAHAEVVALREAAAAAGSWRLEDHTLVVTLEPCPMCAGAAVNARVGRVIYGAADMKAGACLSLLNIGGDPRFNHTFDIINGVRETETAALLQDFFADRRDDNS